MVETELKIGDKLRIISNESDHIFNIGAVVEFLGHSKRYRGFYKVQVNNIFDIVHDEDVEKEVNKK